MSATVAGPPKLPELEPNRELVVPPGEERTLGNGLTVIAIERRSVPLVEIRLRVPFGRSTLDPPFVAKAALLSQTLFSGTASMSMVDIAAALQTVGGALSASVDADRLLVSGNGLASGLDRILDILADVLHGATYPEAEVTTERASGCTPQPTAVLRLPGCGQGRRLLRRTRRRDHTDQQQRDEAGASRRRPVG